MTTIENMIYPLTRIAMFDSIGAVSKDIQKLWEESERNRCEHVISEEALFRYAYIPFVIGELVWDYAESILDACAWLELEGTKPLCRAVRELQQDYKRERPAYQNWDKKDNEDENKEVFEDAVQGIMNQMLTNLRLDLKREYPDLQQEHIAYIACVYQCDILLQSLLVYMGKERKNVGRQMCKKLSRILPDALYKLAMLLPEFVGDKPVSKGFANLRRQYIDTFATQIGLIGMTKTK